MAENRLDELAKQFTESKDNVIFVQFMEELEKSTVFVPAQPSEEVAAKIKAAAAEGKPVPVPKNEAPNICLLAKEDGSKVFPIFTSKDQVPGNKLPPALLNMPFKTVISIVKTNLTQVKDIAVNPFTHGIILNENLIDLADKRFKAQANPGPVSEGQTVQVTEKQFHVIAHSQLAKEKLPQLLFADIDKTLSDIRVKKEDMILGLYKEIYPKELQCPYSEDDIAVMMLQIDENLMVTRVDLPEENKQVGSPLRIYITQNGGEVAYFIIEKGEGKSNGQIAKVSQTGEYSEVMEAPDNGVEIETIMSLVRTS